MNEQHLNFLQNNISRMNQCSFQMKGWSITIVTALIAVYVATIGKNGGNRMFIYISIFATALFWALDAIYLSKERKFIGIYNDIIGITPETERKKIKDYDMPINEYTGWKYSFGRAAIAPTVIFFYLAIIVGLTAFAIWV